MASAVLASRNEPHWGEQKVYMRKYTNSSTNNAHHSRFNPNHNPNSNSNSNSNFNLHINPNPDPSRQIHDSSNRAHVWQSDEPSPRSIPPALSNDSLSLNRRAKIPNGHKLSSKGGYVTFHLAAYSIRELKELKKQLISELHQIRSFKKGIEARGLEFRYTNHAGSHFSGSNGQGIEVVRPPSLQLNHTLDSFGVAMAKRSERLRRIKIDPPNLLLERTRRFLHLATSSSQGKKRKRVVAAEKVNQKIWAQPRTVQLDSERSPLPDQQVIAKKSDSMPSQSTLLNPPVQLQATMTPEPALAVTIAKPIVTPKSTFGLCKIAKDKGQGLKQTRDESRGEGKLGNELAELAGGEFFSVGADHKEPEFSFGAGWG